MLSQHSLVPKTTATVRDTRSIRTLYIVIEAHIHHEQSTAVVGKTSRISESQAMPYVSEYITHLKSHVVNWSPNHSTS